MAQRLVKIGLYIYAVLKRLRDDAPGYDLLHRVFHDQYVVAKGNAELRDKHKISSDSLQSPDNPDAAYRDKGGQKVSGYVTNITETVGEDKPSIITCVQTSPPGLSPLSVDESAQAGAIPDNNNSKTASRTRIKPYGQDHEPYI